MDTRVCKLCGIEQALTEFWPDTKSHSGRRWRCRTCINGAKAAKRRGIVGIPLDPESPRVCTICHIEQRITEFRFATNTRARRRCRLCLNAQQEAWKKANPGKANKHQATYYRKIHPAPIPPPPANTTTRVCTTCHIDQPINAFAWVSKTHTRRRWICATCQGAENKARYKAAPDKIRARTAARAAAHPEEERARLTAWWQAHPGEKRASGQRWAKANPDKRRAHTAQRRARKLAAPINDLTADQFLEVCQAFSFRCAYCPATCKACKAKTHNLTQDHITSFAEKGSHTLWNVVPACQRCNSKKGTKPAPVYVQPLLLTLAKPREETP